MFTPALPKVVLHRCTLPLRHLAHSELAFLIKIKVAEQMYHFFRVVYSLLKRASPLSHLCEELNLLRICGVQYNLSMTGKENITTVETYLADAMCDILSRQVGSAAFRTITTDRRSKGGRAFWLTNMMLTHRGVTFAIALHGHRLAGESGQQLLAAIETPMKETGV